MSSEEEKAARRRHFEATKERLRQQRKELDEKTSALSEPPGKNEGNFDQKLIEDVVSKIKVSMAEIPRDDKGRFVKTENPAPLARDSKGRFIKPEPVIEGYHGSEKAIKAVVENKISTNVISSSSDNLLESILKSVDKMVPVDAPKEVPLVHSLKDYLSPLTSIDDNLVKLVSVMTGREVKGSDGFAADNQKNEENRIKTFFREFKEGFMEAFNAEPEYARRLENVLGPLSAFFRATNMTNLRDLVARDGSVPGVPASASGGSSSGSGKKSSSSKKTENTENVEETSNLNSFLSGLGSGFLAKTGISGILTLLPRIIKPFIGLGGLLTAIVGLAGWAAFDDIMSNPERIDEYKDAFQRLNDNTLQPLFKWFDTKFMPWVDSVSNWAMKIVDDNTLITIDGETKKLSETGFRGLWAKAGKWVNKEIIRFIDDVSNVMNDLGHAAQAVYGWGEWMYNGVSDSIAWIKERWDRGLWGNIMDSLKFLTDALMGEGTFDRLKNFATDMANAFKVMYNFLTVDVPKLFTETIPQFFSEKMTEFKTWVSELDILGKFKEKVTNMFDFLVNMIPSWQDMKGWMASMVPDFMKGWFDGLSGSSVQAAPVAQPVKKTDPIMSAPINPFSDKSPTVVVAPNTTNNSVTNNSAAPSSAPSGRITSQPDQSPLDRELYRFGLY